MLSDAQKTQVDRALALLKAAVPELRELASGADIPEHCSDDLCAEIGRIGIVIRALEFVKTEEDLHSGGAP